jgi:hypothetical protein
MIDLELNENSEPHPKKVPNQKFRLQGRNFFLTYPKCLLYKEEAQQHILAIVACDYVLIAQEQHKDGTPHLHVFITTTKKVSTKLSTYFDIGGCHGNYQTARDSDDVIAYLNKSDMSPLSHGEYIGNKQSVVQKRALQNKLLLSKPLHELVDDGVVHLSQYKYMQQAINLYTLDKTKVPDYMPKKCIWIYGSTGIGKSRYIRDTHPNQVYYKSQNKWWDGYTNEKIVLIDDFDMAGQCLGHLLKIWSDCYSFNAEVKGTTIKPIVEMFYITSQYLPRDIWCSGPPEKHDDQMRQAVERRFTIMTIEDGQLINYYD